MRKGGENQSALDATLAKAIVVVIDIWKVAGARVVVLVRGPLRVRSVDIGLPQVNHFDRPLVAIPPAAADHVVPVVIVVVEVVKRRAVASAGGGVVWRCHTDIPVCGNKIGGRVQDGGCAYHNK